MRCHCNVAEVRPIVVAIEEIFLFFTLCLDNTRVDKCLDERIENVRVDNCPDAHRTYALPLLTKLY